MDPFVLGRGVVVAPGQAAPEAWAGAPRILVGEAELADAAQVVGSLHEAWATRTPVVVELGVDQRRLAEAAKEAAPEEPYVLGPDFEFPLERLHFLVWANTYDARSGEFVWWHGRKALRTLAGSNPGAVADIRTSDGTEVFVDGGPLGPVEAPEPVIHRLFAEAGQARIQGYRSPRAELAEDQLAAVAHGAGPARVIAPAGSGKTRVLTERLRHLVVDRGVDPSLITVLAFNVRAADELKERCADFVSEAGPNIRTINSWAYDICTQEAGRRLPVAEERDVRDIISSLFDMPKKPNTDPAQPYIEALTLIRLGLISPKEVEQRLPDATGIGTGFARFEDELARRGLVDFDEQIYRALRILLEDPGARSRHQASCRILLVDEFQDLTPAHLLLVRLLAAPAYDAFGVGDDDQTLYEYSGATPKFLIDFGSYFPGATEYALGVNYRCAAPIVAAASHVLSYNEVRVKKAIRAHRPPPAAGEPEPLTVVSAPTEHIAAASASVVEEWLAAGERPEQAAVLARVNSALLPPFVALAEVGVPARANLDNSLLARTGVRSALAYLRIGLDPDAISVEDLQEVVRRPSRGLSPMVIGWLTERRRTSLGDIERLAGRLTSKDGPKVRALARDFRQVAAATERSAAEALHTVRKDLRLGAAMDTLDAARSEADRSTHTDDLLALEAVAGLHPDAASFEAWLREVLGRARPKGSAVTLSTIHRVKGREWDQVLIFDVSENTLPHRRAEDVEAERRVFHVALTRGRHRVSVLANSEQPSRFLGELDGSAPRTPASQVRAKKAETLRGTGAPTSRRRERKKSPSGTPALVAELGIEIEAGGTSGRIVGTDADGVLVELGRLRTRVPYGSEVRRYGRTVTLVAPDEGVADQSTPAEAALRSWRTATARREHLSAYLVLTNDELAGIAAAAPRRLDELAKCKGIGPAKLERWGEEILRVLA